MDYHTILLIAIIITITAGIIAFIQRKRRLCRMEKFRIICDDWILRINHIARDSTEGLPFILNPFDLQARRSGVNWIIRCPIKKSYPDKGYTVQVDAIIITYSLVPDKSGCITTALYEIAESTPQWFTAENRRPTFPQIMEVLYRVGRERKFTFAPPIGDTLTPAKQ